MPYPFPDPAVTPEFEAENGITYIWGGDKWVVKTFTSPTNYITPAVADTEYVRIDGTSTMTGNLTTDAGVYGMNVFSNNKPVATQEYVDTYAVPANGTTSTTSPFEVSTAIIHTGYNYFQKSGNSFYISCESGPTIFGVSTESSASASSANYYGKCTAANHIVNKSYLEEHTLPKTGNITISGTTTFTNQTAITFGYSSSQYIETKGGLLFYGLKADNNRPSWEACSVSIDPNNENFSAFNTGKRFYWTGTYAYLNGSVRNYLNTSTWDFRDNDTNNNIILSIDKTKVEYNGTISSNKSVATKEYVDTSVANGVTATWNFFNSSSAGTNTDLDGLWSVSYTSSPTQGQVIVKAKNDTNPIAEGTVVCTMPAETRPTSMAAIRLTSREGTTTADAIFNALDGKITIRNIQGVGSTRLEGMLIYPIQPL